MFWSLATDSSPLTLQVETTLLHNSPNHTAINEQHSEEDLSRAPRLAHAPVANHDALDMLSHLSD